MRLAPFQIDFIRDVYDNPHGTTKAILSIARKNGKTALIAALVLAHLVGPEAVLNSQIISGAMSRDQASLVFNLARKMVELDQTLSDLVRIIPSKKTLIGLPMNVEYKAIAAQATTAHGLSPVLAILDEIGQVKGPQSPFIDTITTAQGAHKAPLLIAISTQAAEDGDLLSIWVDDAEKSRDPRIMAHVYSAPADCSLDDPVAIRAANPALGIFNSEAQILQAAVEAKRMPSAENTFRNLQLNQRISTHSFFVSQSVWRANGGEPRPLSECVEIHGGLDLSTTTDLTAFVLVGRDAEGCYHVHPYIWTPSENLRERSQRDRIPYQTWVQQGHLRTMPGHTVQYERLALELREITDGLPINTIAFDRWKMPLLKAELDRINCTLPLVETGQGFKADQMPHAINQTEAALLNSKVRHGMHPVLTSNAASAVIVKDAALNRKFEKAKSVSRIDGLVAMAMAIAQFSKHVEQKTPDYTLFFL